MKQLFAITAVFVAISFFDGFATETHWGYAGAISGEGHYSIVGTWELVNIIEADPEDFAEFPHWVETYFPNGMGIFYIDGVPSFFGWSIQGNHLTWSSAGWEDTSNFRITDSTFITYRPDAPYPEAGWILRRID
ncbi:MAG: hypothetical protein LBE55_01765 [Clostridiales bacterium]|jgi:hypothetical protein|nr:hypothetical protein [Clostridiales bacterium]